MIRKIIAGIAIVVIVVFMALSIGNAPKPEQGDNSFTTGEWVKEPVSGRIAKITWEPSFGTRRKLQYLNGQEEYVSTYEIQELSENETTNLLRWFAKSAPSYDDQVRVPRKD